MNPDDTCYRFLQKFLIIRILKDIFKFNKFMYCRAVPSLSHEYISFYGGQPSRNDRENPGTGISVPCPGEEVNGTLNCPGIQVNSVNVELFYT